MVKVNLLNIFTGSETPVKRYFLSKILVHIIFSFISNFLGQIILYRVYFILFVTMLLVRKMVKVNLLSISTGSEILGATQQYEGRLHPPISFSGMVDLVSGRFSSSHHS